MESPFLVRLVFVGMKIVDVEHCSRIPFSPAIQPFADSKDSSNNNIYMQRLFFVHLHFAVAHAFGILYRYPKRFVDPIPQTGGCPETRKTLVYYHHCYRTIRWVIMNRITFCTQNDVAAYVNKHACSMSMTESMPL